MSFRSMIVISDLFQNILARSNGHAYCILVEQAQRLWLFHDFLRVFRSGDGLLVRRQSLNLDDG